MSHKTNGNILKLPKKLERQKDRSVHHQKWFWHITTKNSDVKRNLNFFLINSKKNEIRIKRNQIESH